MKKQNLYIIYLLTYLAITVIFVTQVILVNILSVSDYGIYATVIAIISLIEAPLISRGSELVLKMVGEKWHANNRGDALAIMKRIYQSERLIFWSVCLVIIVFSELLSFFIEFNPIYLAILSLSIPMQIGYGTYKSFLTVINNVQIQSVIELTFAVFTLVINYYGVVMFGLTGLVVSVVAASFMKTQISKYLYNYQLNKYSIEINDRYNFELDRREFNRRSVNSVFRIFTQNGITQIDIIILGVLQRPEFVAVYKVGKSLAGLPTKVAIPVWKYLYPRLVKSVTLNDLGSKRATIMNGSLIVFVLFTIIYIAAFIFGENLVRLFYGHDYLEAYSIFMILLIGYGVFYAINGWFKIWVALASNITIGSKFYLFTFILVAVFSYLFNGNSINMAISISTLLVVMTCYSYFRGLK